MDCIYNPVMIMSIVKKDVSDISTFLHPYLIKQVQHAVLGCPLGPFFVLIIQNSSVHRKGSKINLIKHHYLRGEEEW